FPLPFLVPYTTLFRSFNRILAIVMVSVLLLMIVKPHKRFQRENIQMGHKQTILLFISFMCIGFYGGFIQAGVGFLIIAFLTVFTDRKSTRLNSSHVSI